MRIAYGQISGALTWFVFAYQEIARWRANVERLATFSESLDATELRFDPAGHPGRAGADRELRLDHSAVSEPDGRVLLEDANANGRAGDRIALFGPSGSGKRCSCAPSPGSGPSAPGASSPARTRDAVPPATALPADRLAARGALVSGRRGNVPRRRIVDGIRLVGLARFEGRLDDTEAWEQLLSPHEQQQLAIVRVLLQQPDWLFLDKATSALDEAIEKRVYALLTETAAGRDHRDDRASRLGRRVPLPSVDPQPGRRRRRAGGGVSGHVQRRGRRSSLTLALDYE